MNLYDEQTLPPLRSAEDRAERASLRLFALFVWFVTLVVLGAILVSAGGCATDRFLTVEQDQAVRRVCASDGCRMVPLPLWREILQYFRGLDEVKPAPSEPT